MRNNDDFIDALAILSFVVGLANYQENLTQSDKDDLLHKLDQQTRDLLERLEKDLEEQNEMLKEILDELRKKND